MANTICVLLGAGAVMDAGLPGSVGLADKIHQYMLENATDPKVKTQLELLRFLDGGIRFQRGLLGHDPRPAINIEQLATAALRLANRAENPIAPFVSGWNGRLSELESQYKDVLNDFTDTLFGRLAHELREPPPEKIAYLGRVGCLCEVGRVCVYSLNYDTSCEAAFENANVEYVNGFDGGVWSPAMIEGGDPGTIRFLKLHGSLEWVDDSEYGICSLQYPKHPDSSEMNGQPPLLTFGTDAKMKARDPFLFQLYQLADDLGKCCVFVIIGYSFQDDYINELVQQKFTANTQMDLIIVSPDEVEPMLARSAPVLHDSPRVEHLRLGAKKALLEGGVFESVRKRMELAQSESPFGRDA